MVVNGETFKLQNPTTVKEFLTANGYDFSKVAVLYDEDTIEVVRFVGGG